MLSVLIGLSADGCLERFRASGHAGARIAGTNVACAAATALLRTAAEVIQSRRQIRSTGNAPAPGEMELEVIEVPEADQEWVRGVTDYLVQGCLAIQREAPEAVEVRTIRRG